MAPVTTHPGGPFYVWYHDTYGYNPPATVDSGASRYLAWQQGVPKSLAALIPYGAMGPPGQWITGGALTTTPPIVLTAPPTPPPPPPPPPAPPPPLVTTIGSAGGTLLAPVPVPQPQGGVIPETPTQILTGTGPEAPIGTIASDGNLHIGSLTYDALQVEQMKSLFKACQDKGANDRATLVMSTIGVAENGWIPNTCNSSNHCGVFQLDSDWQRRHSYEDTYYWSVYALEQGFYGYGGVLHIEATHGSWSIGEMVQACQGAGPTFASAAAYYNGRVPEASAIAGYFKGRQLQGVPPGAPAGGSTTPVPTTPSTGGVFDAFKAVNWAGDFENLWKDVMRGADETVTGAHNFRDTRVNQIKAIGWTT